MEPDNFLTALQQYGCKEMNVTMERFMQDEEFYYDILQQTMTDPCFTRLGEELKAKEIRAAFDSAHTLKGIVANCGITPLFELIVQIVEPLRAGTCEGLLPIYDQMMVEHDKFSTLLGTIHP